MPFDVALSHWFVRIDQVALELAVQAWIGWNGVRDDDDDASLHALRLRPFVRWSILHSARLKISEPTTDGGGTP